VRLRPERANHVWSYDFVNTTTHDGRALRLLTLIDAYTRECLAIRVARRLGSPEVLGARTPYITPASPWENGSSESFNGKLRDECLSGELFYSLKEAQIVIEQWRVR
jgi:putative transposase